MGHSSWTKQLVPQEMAGNSQIRGVRYGISHSLKVSADLGTAQEIIIVQEMGCQGHSRSARAGPSFSMFSMFSCPSILQGKGPLTQGLGRTSIWFCTATEESSQFPVFHVSPHSMLLVRDPSIEGWVYTSTYTVWIIFGKSFSLVEQIAPMSPLWGIQGPVCSQWLTL